MPAWTSFSTSGSGWSPPSQRLRPRGVRSRRRDARRRVPVVLRRSSRPGLRIGRMAASPLYAETALDLAALGAITDAVESGHGLPEVVLRRRPRAGRLAHPDRPLERGARGGRPLAGRRARADERRGGRRHARAPGGRRGRRAAAPARRRQGAARRPAAARDATLIASEVERLRAPERASEAAQEAFPRAVLHRRVTDRGDIVARAAELGVDVEQGAAVIVVRAHDFARPRTTGRGAGLAAAERAARAAAPGAIAAIDELLHDTAGHVLVLAPADAEPAARRAAEAVARELQATLHGFTFSRSASRASRSTRPTSTGAATRRCWPRTSPRRSRPATARPGPRGPRVRGRRAPTGCCCPR